ncbi:hypothetical protein ACFE04_027467 [Oxalis oulophora]
MGTINDPFGFIERLCHVSSSQELHLNRCRFDGVDEASESSQSARFPLQSTPIIIETLPESSDDWIEIDDSTPPEVTVSTCLGDVDRVVAEETIIDLEIDDDVQSELRVEEIRGFVRESSNSSSRLVKSVDMLKLNRKTNLGKRVSKQSESCEFSRGKKWKLDSSFAELNSRVEEEKRQEIVNRGAAGNEENENCLEACEVVRIPITVNIGDDNECRHVDSNMENLNKLNGLERKTLAMRVLPESICGGVKAAGEKLTAETSERNISEHFIDKYVRSSIVSRNNVERKTHEWVRWPDSRDEVEAGKVRNSAFATVLKALKILSER